MRLKLENSQNFLNNDIVQIPLESRYQANGRHLVDIDGLSHERMPPILNGWLDTKPLGKAWLLTATTILTIDRPAVVGTSRLVAIFKQNKT